MMNFRDNYCIVLCSYCGKFCGLNIKAKNHSDNDLYTAHTLTFESHNRDTYLHTRNYKLKSVRRDYMYTTVCRYYVCVFISSYNKDSTPLLESIYYSQIITTCLARSLYNLASTYMYMYM